MIKHIVLFKFKKEFPNAAQEAKAKLEELPSKIDVIRSFQVGIDIMHSERSYDLALIGEYDSMEDLKKYDQHPEHLKVRNFIHGVRETSVSLDFEF